MITLDSVPGGRYQIALSEEAWVEAIQDNARLPIRPSGRTVECRGARGMNVAVVRIWPFEWRGPSHDFDRASRKPSENA